VCVAVAAAAVVQIFVFLKKIRQRGARRRSVARASRESDRRFARSARRRAASAIGRRATRGVARTHAAKNRQTAEAAECH
jgi:hypothetical protein